MAILTKRHRSNLSLLDLTCASPNRSCGRASKADLALSCFRVCARFRLVCTVSPSCQAPSGSKTRHTGRDLSREYSNKCFDRAADVH
jgi:hypothetical protein